MEEWAWILCNYTSLQIRFTVKKIINIILVILSFFSDYYQLSPQSIKENNRLVSFSND